MLIRVLLVDDHALLRQSLARELDGVEDILVVGQLGDGEEALELVEQMRPDVVLLDVSMPGIGGQETARLMRKALPQVRVLACSQYTDAETVLGMLASGATGYVNKGADLAELLDGVRAVAQGSRFLGKDVEDVVRVSRANARARRPAPISLPRLSPREEEVLRLIAEGRRTREIAETLGVSVRTVETHRVRIMRKLGIRSVAGLTKYALRKHLVEL